MKILVTGGAGYIGSHCCVELLEEGIDTVCVDNFANSSPAVLDGIQAIAGKKMRLYECDITDEEQLTDIMVREGVDGCIHFAGLKSVSESIDHPEEYYRVNMTGTQVLCRAMKRAGVWNLIYSSSATVYGEGSGVAFTEDSPVVIPETPYGKTKLFVEQMLMDYARVDSRWVICLMRYFNPVGAHPSGIIGETPVGRPNNLMPSILEAAAKSGSRLKVFGNDYPTRDGTCIRDFIHVRDLVQGHIAALRAMERLKGANVYNLGSGKGVTVKELISAFEWVNDVTVPHVMAPRRQGDVHTCFADTNKARIELGWEATSGVEEMVRDAWTYWKKMNQK